MLIFICWYILKDIFRYFIALYIEVTNCKIIEYVYSTTTFIIYRVPSHQKLARRRSSQHGPHAICPIIANKLCNIAAHLSALMCVKTSCRISRWLQNFPLFSRKTTRKIQEEKIARPIIRYVGDDLIIAI